MKSGRLFWVVSLVVAVFGIGIWLMVRGAERQQSDAKAPPSPLTFKGTVPKSRPLAPGETGETAPPVIDIGIPSLRPANNGDLLRGILTGAVPAPKVPAAVVERYLQQRGRTAANLIAAWQVSDNADYLQEAARFEHDPRVQFAILVNNSFPSERSKWITLFRQSSSFNPLAHCFAAQEYFRQNQTDQAVAELVAASTAQRFEDYFAVSFQDCEELFRAAGASPIEARTKAFATTFLTLQPCGETMGELAQMAAGAQAAYATAEDPASAQNLARAAVALAQQMNVAAAGRLAVYQLAGISIEETVLKQFPADEPLDWLGQTPATRLAQLQQEREQMDNLSASCRSNLPGLQDAELGEYLDHVKQSGELEAMKWLASRPKTAP